MTSIGYRNTGPLTPRNQQDPTEREIRRQQGRVNGIDVSAITNPQGQVGYQEALPEVDIKPTWGPRRGANGMLQQGFALTIRSMRAGLEMQRDFVAAAHARQSESSLVSHARDELILPFAHEQQVNLQAFFSNYNILSATINDRLVMTPYGYQTGGVRIFIETSSVDPTVQAIQFSGSNQFVFGLQTVLIAGVENLLILTSNGAYFSTINGLTMSTIGPIIFNTISEPAVPASSGVIVHPTTGLNVGWWWNSGRSAVYDSFIGVAAIQSPLPGNPLIVRGGNSSLLIPTEPTEEGFTAYNSPGALMLRNIGLANVQPIGWATIGGRKAKSYWLETGTGGPAADGPYISRISSLDSYGMAYEVHRFSMTRILGACLIENRGALAIEDGYHIILWNGREDDLGLFADEAPTPGYTLFCTGVYTLDGQLYAEINELPNPDAANPYGSGIGQGRIRACKRRYDFDLRRWHQISEWLTLTEEGLIRWNNGVPVPVGHPVDLKYGFMSVYGAPALPMGRVTRAMHNHFMPARYSADLTAVLPLPTSGQFSATWTNKFEPPAGTNPYSFRGSDKAFATDGRARSPGMLFDGEMLYADKYFDEVYTGANDTGGPNSSWTVRIGEYGHLDDVDSNGRRTSLDHTFHHGLSHAQRRRKFASNKTSILFPQFEFEITRGDDPFSTPQIFPATFYFHVDIPEHDAPEAQEFGRSKA